MLNILSDNVVELSGLKNEITGAFINNATVTAKVVDRNGVDVAGQSWPVTLTYVSSSDGVYRGTLSDSMSLARFDLYTVQVTASAGAGLQQYWECEGSAQVAGCI